MKKLFKSIFNKKKNTAEENFIEKEKSDAVEFAIWLRDNFSPLDSAKKGGKFLHKSCWRRDFSDEILGVDTIYDEFCSTWKIGVINNKLFQNANKD